MVRKKLKKAKRTVRTKSRKRRSVLHKRKSKTGNITSENLFDSEVGETDGLFVDNPAVSGKVEATIDLNNMAEFLQVPIKVPVPVRLPVKQKEFSKRKFFAFSNSFISILIGLIFAGVFCAGVYVLATDWPYTPPAPLDPGCAPTTSGCNVVLPYLTSTGDASGLTGLTSSQITTALGFTPYNATNPAGYLTSASLTGYVPYTGATTNLDLGTNQLAFSGNGYSTINNSSGNLLITNYGGSLMLGAAYGSIYLTNLTNNGFVKTSGSSGALSVDTTAYTPASRTLTINGTTYDLSTDRSWTVNSMVYPSGSGIPIVASGTSWGTTITDNSSNWNTGYTYRFTSASGTSPLTLTLNSNVLTGSISQANTSTNGYLSSTDWNTFNGKMANPMNASGDIIYGGASGAPTRLGKGTDGQVLTLASGVPTWAAGGGAQTPWTSNIDAAGYNLTGLGNMTMDNQLINYDNTASGTGNGGWFMGRDKITPNQLTLDDSQIGQTWTAQTAAGSRSWNGIAMSSDGKYQTAIVDGFSSSDYIYVSSDYGTTWTPKGSSGQWHAVAMSSDGKHQTAVFGGGPSVLYTSSDYGQTWTSEGVVGGSYLDSVAMSSDGKYQTATAGGQYSLDYIYISSDYGVTWTSKDSNRHWMSVAMSSDGKYQTATVGGWSSSGYIYISSDYGHNWSQEGSNHNWEGIAMSSDGKYQTAVDAGNYAYVSSDYGATWAQEGNAIYGIGVAMSSDGKYQASAGGASWIYISSDYGQTWIQKSSIGNWHAVAMSSDGKYITAGNYSGFIYTSYSASSLYGDLTINGGGKITMDSQIINYDNTASGTGNGGWFMGRDKITPNQLTLDDSSIGNTWTAEATDATRNWQGVAMSSDGKYQTAVAFSGYIYISSDYGTTWTPEDSSRSWFGVAMSSDGKYQTAIADSGNIYISSDYGATWAPEDSARTWWGVAMSSDGKYQTAVVIGGNIYISSDYGATWTSKDSSRSWFGVAMSSDGKYQTATVQGGYIYISSNYGATWMPEVTDSGRSWQGVAMSSDGKYQTSVVWSGNIYVSSNYGHTWAPEDSSRPWVGVAMSSDGKHQTAAPNSGYIYVSRNTSNLYGSLNISGTYLNSLTDVAEDYPTKDVTLSAGEIVSLDIANSMYVGRANSMNSSSILGIVSTAPGMELGADKKKFAKETKVPVALAGRVPVKVDLENGAINIGDRITLSTATPGVGMKASAGSNTVGIALESFDGTEETATTPTPTQTTPTACVADSDCTSGQTCVNSFCTEPTSTSSPTGIILVFVQNQQYSISSSGTIGNGQIAGVGGSSFLQSVKDSLANLGIKFANGVTNIATLATKQFTTDTATVKQLQIVAANGDVYCTWIDANGDWQKVKGDCATVSSNASAQGSTLIPTSATTLTTPSTSQPTSAQTQSAINIAQQAADAAQQAAQQAQQAQSTAQQAQNAAQQAQSAAEQAQQQVAQTPQAVNIASVAAIPDINVAYGTAIASISLPGTVNVTLSDSTNQTVSITWDNGTPAYDANTSGTYVFSGTLTFSGNITNTNNLTAIVNVIVAPQPASDATGELIQNAASSLLNGVWNFIKSIFVSGAQKAAAGLVEPILKLFGK